jgi:putative DNA-invertase from lambdoid prophage Rac
VAPILRYSRRLNVNITGAHGESSVHDIPLNRFRCTRFGWGGPAGHVRATRELFGARSQSAREEGSTKTTDCGTRRPPGPARIETYGIDFRCGLSYDTPLRYNMSRTFSYARVSTPEQTTDNQLVEIAAAGFAVKPQRVFVEAVSGKVPAMQRPQFSKLLSKLEEDDVLIVTKLDRLGRDTADVLATLKKLTELGVRVHCLALGGMDLISPAGKMTMTVLAAVAEFERDLLVERTQAGLARAREQGKRLGRPVTYDAERKRLVIEAVKDGASIRAAAGQFRLSAGTVQRILSSNPSS